jgi:hypothetical protein
MTDKSDKSDKAVKVEKSDKSATKQTGTVRVQKASVIGVSVNMSRVRDHLDNRGINKETVRLIQAVNTVLASFPDKCDPSTMKKFTLDGVHSVVVSHKKVEGEDEPRNDYDVNFGQTGTLHMSFNDLEGLNQYFKSAKIRFSERAIVALTVACNYIIEDLMRHGMESALKAGKSQIKIEHVLSEGVSELPYTCLVSTCPSFHVPTDDDASDADDSTVEKKERSFYHFVRQICTVLKRGDSRFESLQITRKICEMGSQLIKEFIGKLSRMIPMYQTHGHTIKDVAVKGVIGIILQEHYSEDTSLIETIEDRVTMYENHKTARKNGELPVVPKVVKPAAPKKAAAANGETPATAPAKKPAAPKKAANGETPAAPAKKPAAPKKAAAANGETPATAPAKKPAAPKKASAASDTAAPKKPAPKKAANGETPATAPAKKPSAPKKTADSDSD